MSMKKATSPVKPIVGIHAQRPLTGVDIPRFQGRHGLDKDDVTYYLGIAHYNKKCQQPSLEYSLELLMRLFDENPSPPPWKRDRMTIRDLFNLMYGKKLEVFKGTEHEVEAKVDLQNRFSKLLGRSKGRAYRWLDEDAIKAGASARTHSDILGILGKLTQCADPAETLERLGKFTWGLRGEDIDELFPIPTPKNPPKREKRGRRPKVLTEEEKAALKKKVKVGLRDKGIVVKKPVAPPAKKAPIKPAARATKAAKKASSNQIKGKAK